MQKICLLIYLVIVLIGRLFMLTLRLVALPLILVVLLVQWVRGQLSNFTTLELDILRKAEETISRYRTALVKPDRDYCVAAEHILRAKADYLSRSGSKRSHRFGREILMNLRADMFRDPHSIENYFRLGELLDEVNTHNE